MDDDGSNNKIVKDAAEEDKDAKQENDDEKDEKNEENEEGVDDDGSAGVYEDKHKSQDDEDNDSDGTQQNRVSVRYTKTYKKIEHFPEYLKV